jgi:hypothetical protein
MKIIAFLSFLFLYANAAVNVWQFNTTDSSGYEGSGLEYHCIDNVTGIIQGLKSMVYAFEGQYFSNNNTANVKWYSIGSATEHLTTLTYSGSTVTGMLGTNSWTGSNLVANPVGKTAYESCLFTSQGLGTKTLAGYWDYQNSEPNYLCISGNQVTGWYRYVYEDTQQVETGTQAGTGFGINGVAANFQGTFTANAGPYAGTTGPIFVKAELNTTPPSYRAVSCFKNSTNAITECFPEYYELVQAGVYTNECANGPAVGTTAATGMTTGSPASINVVSGFATLLMIAFLLIC